MTAGPREVAPGVYRFGTRFVNWYAVEEAGRLTLVDAGMPGHWRQLEPGIAALGRTVADVEAIVLTHAHVDHVGFAERIRREREIDVLVEARDANAAVRKFPPLRLYWRPASWPFLVEGLRCGLLGTPPVRRFHTFADGAVLDVPSGLRAVHVPGHTAGSVALHLPERGVLLTGDALVTLDPYTMATGPRLMLDGVHENASQARASLQRLVGIEAALLLPGHGEPWSGDPVTAVQRALDAPA